MSDRQAKDALFDAFASVSAALGSGRRAEIVDVLAQGERSVDEMATEIGQSLANTSHHLRVLARPLLRVRRRRGAAPAGARPGCPPAGRRVPGVAPRRTAGGGRRWRCVMLLRPFLNDATSCASYLFGCTTHRTLAVVDPHADLVGRYLDAAAAAGQPIVAVFETHVQADHVSGLPELIERTGATAYLPAGAGVEFDHVAVADGEVVELGNTSVWAIATPGHAPAHHAYTVADLRRGEEPWL